MTYKKKKVGNQPYYAEFIKGDQKQPGSKTAPTFTLVIIAEEGKPETFRPKPNTDRRDDRSSGGFGNRDGEKKPWDGKPSFSARSFDKPAYKKRDDDRPSYGDKPAFNLVKLRDSAPEGVQYGRPITFFDDFFRPSARPSTEPTDD